MKSTTLATGAAAASSSNNDRGLGHLLPEDLHYTIETLSQLFLKPKLSAASSSSSSSAARQQHGSSSPRSFSLASTLFLHSLSLGGSNFSVCSFSCWRIPQRDGGRRG